MGRNAEIETEGEVLKRIVALLFSFACLAEYTSGRSYPVRCLVLWALRHAEAVVRDWLVEGSPDGMQSNAPTGVLHRNSRAEAIYLANAFRALAHELRRQLRLEQQLARRLMRGKAGHTVTGAPQNGPFAPDRLRRFARAISAVLSNMESVACATAPRIDTS